MGILGNLDADFFKGKVAAPKVTLHRESVMEVIAAFVTHTTADLTRKIDEINNSRYYRPHEKEQRTTKFQAQLDIMSVWNDPAQVDRRLTKLMAIPGLVKIWGEMSPRIPFPIGKVPYLMAQTEDIILEGKSRYWETEQRWDLGPYIIMLPLGGQTGEMHWIPMREPTTHNRHPHHRIKPSIVNRDQLEVSTCLGGFADSVAMALQIGDINTVLKFMTDYVKSWNPDSVLRHMEELPHARRL